MATWYKINVRLWKVCSAVIFCLLVFFVPGEGKMLSAWQIIEGVFVVLAFAVPYAIAFGVVSIVLGGVVQAFCVIIWSELTKRLAKRDEIQQDDPKLGEL